MQIAAVDNPIVLINSGISPHPALNLCLPLETNTANTCTHCPAGQYLPSNDPTLTCQSCTSGTFSVAGATACTGCGAGEQMTGTSTAGSCQTCSAGKYKSDSGPTQCVTIPKKHYRTSTRSIAQCLAGTYQNVAGSNTCKACPSGQYQAFHASCALHALNWCNLQNGRGKESCKTCALGELVNSDQSGCDSSDSLLNCILIASSEELVVQQKSLCWHTHATVCTHL